MIESKSSKLYFNSFNNTKFKSIDEVETTVKKDLEDRIKSPITIIIKPLNHVIPTMNNFTGECIDHLDIDCTTYQVDANFLKTSHEIVEESLYSDLLNSNCLVTGQPDWASLQIIYKGNKINREGLLRYIVSYRNHKELHEQCIERIFVDIMKHCKPTELTVYGRYTRRGGLDINPYRSTNQVSFEDKNIRLLRQ